MAIRPAPQAGQTACNGFGLTGSLNPAAGELLADQVELIERAVADGHRPRARIAVGGDPHRQAEELLEVVLHRDDVGIAAPDRARRAAGAAPGARPSPWRARLLDLAHREPLVGRALRQRLGILVPDQRARVAHVDAAGLEMPEHPRRQPRAGG